MAWSGTLNSISTDGYQVTSRVTIYGPSGTFIRDFGLSSVVPNSDYVTWLRGQVIAWASQIDEIRGYATTVTPGQSINFNSVIQTPDPDYVQFTKDMVQLRRFKRAVDFGIIPGTYSGLVNSQTLVLATLSDHPEFIAAIDLLH
jgi:hypothetical protein